MNLKKENVPFTMVANEVLKDKNLSFKAKGLYSYLFSKPDDWDFSGHRMILETTDGKRAIFSALKELEENNYLSRERMPNGRMQYTLKHSVKTLVSETDTRIEKPNLRFSNKPKQQQAETATISNTVLDTNTEEKVKQTSGVPPQDIQFIINSFKEVNPSYNLLFGNTTQRGSTTRLLKKYGKEKLTSMVLSLPGIISQPYAPKIITPYDLEKDMGRLLAFLEQNKNITKNKKPIVHI